jgi:hypothetical protein
MSAMETMAIAVPPEQRLSLDVKPGDRVRMAVRQQGDDLVLVWLKRRS